MLIDQFEKHFMSFNRWLLILILAVMSVIIFANVSLRYTTSQSIEWAEEVARHLMIWLTFLGCGPVLRYGCARGDCALDQRILCVLRLDRT
jgi:TRAP-type C4-dicarboxylate transport system permease small subunit